MFCVGKELGVVFFFVGYVTKDGSVVGLCVLEYFVDCVLSHIKPFNGGEAGWRVVQLLEAANRSLKKRGVIVYV